MNGPKDDDVRDLLAPWALDAVDDVERTRVERAVAQDPQLAEEARALRETAARLALGSATSAPAHVREAVMAAVERTEQHAVPPEPATAEETAHHHAAHGTRGRSPARWLALAAVLVLGAVVPTGLAYQQHERARHAEQQVTTIAEALARPGARLVRSSIDGGGQAVAVVAADGHGLVTTSGLPRLHGHDYQLWVVDDRGASSAGLLAASGGTLTAEARDIPPGGSLAITVEPAGGSRQPTTTPIVVLTAR